MKNVLQPLTKSVLIPLGLIAATSAANAGMHKKFYDLEQQHTTKCCFIVLSQVNEYILTGNLFH